MDGEPVGRVWSFRDRTAERRLEEDLRRMAYTDELTGLPNRALFMSRGRALAEAAEGSGRPLGVAVHPSGAPVYVADWYASRVLVIDPGTGAVTGTIAVGASSSIG